MIAIQLLTFSELARAAISFMLHAGSIRSILGTRYTSITLVVAMGQERTFLSGRWRLRAFGLMTWHPLAPRTRTCRQTSTPRQDLLQLREELLPTRLGAPEGLLLIRPEARLRHAQVGA